MENDDVHAILKLYFVSSLYDAVVCFVVVVVSENIISQSHADML